MELLDKNSTNTAVGWNAEMKDITGAHLHTNAAHFIPLFQYDPPKVGRHIFGTVSVDDKVFHNISNMEDFYIAMGRDGRAKNKQPSGDEFIWERYICDNAKLSKSCLQNLIQAYLQKNSAKFRELYGHKHNEMIGTCNSNIIDHDDKLCANCPMARGDVRSFV